MKTAMQELLEHFIYVRELDPYVQTILLEQRAKELLAVEKEQIIESYRDGRVDQQSDRYNGTYNRKAIEYYNQTFKVEQ